MCKEGCFQQHYDLLVIFVVPSAVTVNLSSMLDVYRYFTGMYYLIVLKKEPIDTLKHQ